MLHPACRDSRYAGTRGSAPASFEGANDMTWADLYLICFIVGFALSLISVLGGFFHVPGLHHAPHGHHGHVHISHGHGHAGGAQVSPLNFSTITAFLAWFGG